MRQPEALVVQLAHATRGGNDLRLRLVPVAADLYDAELPPLAPGRWRLSIEDPRREWRLGGRLGGWLRPVHPGGDTLMRKAIWILWPAFIVGGAAEVVFFTAFDPTELHLFGQPAGSSRLAVYSLGFLFFWAFAAASSALTCYFQRSAGEINR